jgi:4-alpha-glucanotransferase
MTDLTARRQAGLLIPLFSFPSTTSWGIGEIADLVPMAAWLSAAHVRLLQLLPLNEMAPGQHSPYSAISAMAIDPIFIRVLDVAEFQAEGGEAALDDDERMALDRARRSPCIDYASVRWLKDRVFRRAFKRFVDAEWSSDSERAQAFKRFVTEQAWWVEDYALFRAIHAREDERPWTEWPEPLQRREPGAVDRARRELAHEVRFYQYLQWLAASQWAQAKAATRGVALFGDLPFMVDGDSADVWAKRQNFRLDVSVGVPPDAFSATGQDWGMPVYNWETMAIDDFRWLRERARRSADLFDAYRVDHLVGFYRTYGRPKNGTAPFFTPTDESVQTSLGERVLTILRQAGSAIVAEDLGTVPDFVRASLVRLGVPGLRVLRWERHWHVDGEPFREPTEYPAQSVATSGTHDTEPLLVWWERASEEEKLKVEAIPTVRRLSGGTSRLVSAPFIPQGRDLILEALFASGSNLLFIPVPDLFGWRDRINEPATVNETNWTFRMPWAIDLLDQVAEAQERQQTLRRWVERYQRG